MFSEAQLSFISNHLDSFQLASFSEYCSEKKIDKIGRFLFTPPMDANNVFETNKELTRFITLANELIACDLSKTFAKLDDSIASQDLLTSKFFNIITNEHKDELFEKFSNHDFSFNGELHSKSQHEISIVQNERHESIRNQATFIKKIQLISYSLISIIIILSFVRLGASL